MNDAVIIEETKKFLRAHILGTEYVDSREFALDLILKIESLRARSDQGHLKEVATPSERSL